MTSYREAVDFLFSQLPMYQRIGQQAFKKDLTNIIALCEALDQPHLTFPSIHVGGTNGKGTVSHLLAFMLQESGYKVGLYTSPHYKDYRERIKVNGKPIDKKSVVTFLHQHQTAIELIRPSFFEMTVALAFEHFRKTEVDIAVIEVGLGGRLDSTNVIRPELSVITNISFDHMDMLGNTLVEIAGEKAGIIKKNTPVIIGEYQPEVDGVFQEKAKIEHAPLIHADRLLSYTDKEDGFSVLKGGSAWMGPVSTKLLGPYQGKNIVTAFCAGLHLKNFTIDWERVTEGFGRFRESVGYRGRWEKIHDQPDVLVDSAHNEGGMRFLGEYFDNLPYKNLHIVCGFVRDKDIVSILSHFPKHARYYFAKAKIPRGLDAAELREKARETGRHGKAYTSVRKALSAAKKRAESEDLIFVGGSIFTVAEVLPA